MRGFGEGWVLSGWALGLVLLLCGSASANVPVGPEQRGEAFAEAMRGGQAALQAFARTHLAAGQSAADAAPKFAERMQAMLVELGAVERHWVQGVNDRLVFVFLRHAGSGGWKNYQFRVLPQAQGRLQLVFRADAIEPLARPSAPLDSEEARQHLQALVQRLGAEQAFSGVAAVAERGREVFLHIQGLADASRQTPVQRGSVFGMASGSKLFTAVAVLQLVQRGRIDLKRPLSAYLPDFPDRGFAQRTRIEQLLTHTAGAGNYWDEEYDRQRSEITETAQMLPHVLRRLDANTAGRYVYSNSGYLLLGLVVESVSGLPFHAYVHRHILKPAGMQHTGYPLREELPPTFAYPYLPEWEAGAAQPDRPRSAPIGGRGTAAGGAVTTLDDMLRFAQALSQHRLLDARHLDLLTQATVPVGAGAQHQGLGAAIDLARGVRSFGHGGRAPGTHFDLRLYPERGAVLVVMSNLDTIAGAEIASALDHLVRNSVAADRD